MIRRSLVAALCVAASVPLGVSDGMPGLPCAGAAPGSVRAAVVVDFGSLGGSNTVDCVTVPAGANGYALLAARAAQLGLPGPRTDASGNFLCGIDGLPAQSCAIEGGDPNAYWSFWRATPDSAWAYANVGLSTTVRDGELHGWRFVTTPGSSADLAPRIAPSRAACPAAPTTTVPTTAAPPAPPRPTPSVPVDVRPGTLTPGPSDPAPVAVAGGGGDPTVTTSGPTSTSTTPSTTTTPPTTSTEVLAGDEPGVEFSRGADTPAAEVDDADDDGGSAGLIAAAVVIIAAVGLAVVQSRRTRLRG